MDKDNSVFDFDNDPDFNANFYKNIEKVLGEEDSAKQEPAKIDISDIDLPEEQINVAPVNEVDSNSEVNIADNSITEGSNTENGNIGNRSTDNSTISDSYKVSDANDSDTSTSDANTSDANTSSANTSSANINNANNNSADTSSADTNDAYNSNIDKSNINTSNTENNNVDNSNTDNSNTDNNNTDNSNIRNANTDSNIQDKNIENNNVEIDDELTDINESLAKQISNEMENESLEFSRLQKKKRFWKIQSGVVLTVLCLIGFCFFFGFTKPGNAILMRMGVNISGTIWGSMTNKFSDSTDVVEDIDYLDDEDLNSTAPELDPSTIVWPDHPGVGRQEEGVYNILLLGEEQIGMGKGRGRTDVIVIATLNTNDKTVKLTSLMRDMYVQIPGYQDNKLNTAYEKGGLDLLYETIAVNFDLRLDGCVMVNFEHFEQIIDELGGIELTLKQNEADYLNSTNYISNPANRNVVAGTQLMNGNQVLGYARVRKTSTITGNNNDYGRTDRHRAVLNAIFEKCKSKSKTDLVALMFKFLPMITSDVDSKCFQAMLNAFIDMGMNTAKIQQLRIPADGTFQDNVKVRGMSVLIPDLPANIEELHSFIFGDQTTDNQTTTGQTTSDTSTGTDVSGN